MDLLNGTNLSQREGAVGPDAAKSLSCLARPERFELPTFWFAGDRQEF